MLHNIAWNNTIQRFLFLCHNLWFNIQHECLEISLRSRGQWVNYQWVAKINKCANEIVPWCDLPTNKKNPSSIVFSIYPSFLSSHYWSKTKFNFKIIEMKKCLRVFLSVEPKLCLICDLWSLCLLWFLQQINHSQVAVTESVLDAKSMNISKKSGATLVKVMDVVRHTKIQRNGLPMQFS